MIRAPVYGLWSGLLTVNEFIDSMQVAIRMGIGAAWRDASKVCGIDPDEWTDEEKTALQDFVVTQFQFVQEFGIFIANNSKMAGKRFSSLSVRSELWVNSWNAAYNQAMALFRKNQKMKWVLGATKEHCTDCLKYNGKVKRASQWKDAGISPQMRALECKGYRCKCKFEVTNDPMSKGPLPKPSGSGAE
jgi:hypothetical protein